MTILFSYRDADVHLEDLVLFEDGQWLNDSCINFCFRRLEDELNSNKVLLVDPCLVSFLRFQVDADEEFEELASGLGVKEKTWLLVPINDCSDLLGASTHWSLLLCNIESGYVAHCDSCGNTNFLSATKTTEKLCKLLGRYHTIQSFRFQFIRFSSFFSKLFSNRKLSVPVSIRCPQQTNGYDCGVYTILFARAACVLFRTCPASDVAENLMRSGLGYYGTEITPSIVTQYRIQCIDDIHARSKSSKISK
jgi:Ulp1 family protease